MFEIIGLTVCMVGILGLIGLSFIQIIQGINVQQNTRETLTVTRMMAERIALIDRYVANLHTLISADMMNSGGADGKDTFATPDGKHTANSIEDLIKKIIADPDYNKANPDEIQRLKNFFEEQQRKEEEDGNEPDEPWMGDKS